MEAVTTRPKQSYKFDRKLTPEEIQALVDNYDYDPSVYDSDDLGDGVLFDRFGNPTEALIRSRYETEHGYTEGPFTLDELFAEFDKWRAEADEI
ncbi:MAG: hypothetical protein IJQ58_07000 [Synergistaceae bacterium]|nr:hypothetical protein [Synergistaceae bacterium]